MQVEVIRRMWQQSSCSHNMWLLFIVFLCINGAPIDLAKFEETNARFKQSMNQLQECFNSTMEYKDNSTFRPMTVEEAKVARDEIYSCLLKGEKVLREKDDYIRSLGVSPNIKPQKFSVSSMLVAMLTGDMAPLAGIMNFAMDAMKMPIAIMKSDIKQLDKYIASGDAKVLGEELDSTELKKIAEQVKKEAEEILPNPKEVEKPTILLLVPKPENGKEKGGIAVLNLEDLANEEKEKKAEPKKEKEEDNENEEDDSESD